MFEIDSDSDLTSLFSILSLCKLSATHKFANSIKAMVVPTLLTVAELKSKLGGPVVVDGSWHMPAAKRDPIKEFREDGHIPGGKRMDSPQSTAANSPRI